MPFAEHFMVSGSFTVPATFDATHPLSLNINCGFLPTKIQLIDETQFGTSSANENIQTVDWNSNFPTTSKIQWMTASATTLNNSIVTTNGISLYDGSKGVQYAPVLTGTTIVKSTGVFTTTTNHGFQIGDTVLVTNNVVMTQIGGMKFQIATVPTATSFTVVNGGFLNASGFSQESAFKVKKVIVGNLFYPEVGLITAATAANPIVISLAPGTNFPVGMQVRIRVPSAFGMTQANNLQGVITAVTNTATSYNITIGSIDSSAFTAFAWPANTSVPLTYAQVIPIGAGPSPVTEGNITYNVDTLLDATINNQFKGFTIGTGIFVVGAAGAVGVQASDVFTWTAWRGDV